MIDDCPYSPPSADDVCSWNGYLYFVWEREAIRILHDDTVGRRVRPYTQDPVLQRYRFCNIRRADDRVSRWMIQHLIEPRSENPDLWFQQLIARLLNWPPTLAMLMGTDAMPYCAEDFDAGLFEYRVELVRRTRGKAYGGAYMIYPTRLESGRSKAYLLGQYILLPAAREAERLRRTVALGYVQPVVEELANLFGVSTFMAGQVAADLTYCEQLGSAPDLYTYAPLGPGSQVGLNYLHGRPLSHAWKQADFNTVLGEARERIVSELEIDGLTLHDVQNTFCEYGKYCRAVLGGRLKTLYTPEKEF